MTRVPVAAAGQIGPGRGRLPAGWRWLALKRCCSVQRGAVPVYAHDRRVAIINQACVHWDGLRWQAVKWHCRSAVPDRGWLRPGDVLINSTGSGTLGRAVLFEPNDAIGRWVVADSHVTILRPGPALDGRYLKYCIETPSYQRFLNTVLASGATKQQELSRDGLRRLPIPLPPIAVQRTIADRLDQVTHALSEALERKHTLVETLEERFQARAEHALSGGFGRWSSRPGRPSLPVGWRTVPLMHLVDPARPITYGIVQPGPAVAAPAGVPLIKAGHVDPIGLRVDRVSRTSSEIAASHPRGRLRAGDLVMAIRGTVGAVAEVPHELDGATITQDVARIAPRDGVDRRWLAMTLGSRIVQRQVELGLLGATVLGLNLRDLRRLMLPVPPAADQPRIGRRLAKQKAALVELAETTRESCRRLREYRQALLTTATFGRSERIVPIESSVLDAVAAG